MACQTTMPFLNLNAASDSHRHVFSEYAEKLYLNITDDATGQVKGHFLPWGITGFAQQSSHIQWKETRLMNMNCVIDASM